MPLQQVATTEAAAANQVAQRIVNQIVQTATQINQLRTNGVPAVDEQPARQGPNGQTIPARPATAAVSAASINAALGEENCALLDQLKIALGL